MAAKNDWSSTITFFLNGKKVELPQDKVHPRMTLSEYLREHTQLTGTKVSCTQGGCGACNVMLTTFKAGKPTYSSVNSCLRPIVSLDGCGVTTTEGIGSSKTGLHPVQERIAACNGTQCGYCTPGQVMAMYSLLRDKASRPESGPLTLAEVEERFDGNICRCTGYRAIMTAFHTFADEPVADSTEIAGLAPLEFPKYDAAKEPLPPEGLAELAASPKPLMVKGADGTVWFRPTSIDGIQEARKFYPTAKLVCGFTSQGVYGYDTTSSAFIDISKVPEVAAATAGVKGALALPATTTITELIRTLEKESGASASFAEMAAHFKKVASWQVRNIGSITGNLMMCRTQHFMSDLATVLMGAGAKVRFTEFGSGKSSEVSLHDFVHSAGDAKVTDGEFVVTAVVIPFLTEGEHFRSYRQANRPNNAHALVNAAFRVTVDGSGTVTAASLAFGCIDHAPVFATESEKAVVGKKLGDKAAVAAALAGLASVVIKPEKEYVTTRSPGGNDGYRRALMEAFLFKFFVSASKGEGMPPSVASAGEAYTRPTTTGSQQFMTELPEDHPGRTPMSKVDAGEQASGQVKYSDDVQLAGQLFAAFVLLEKAPAVVTAIDARDALTMPGVVDFVAAADIPAFNCVTPLGPGEEMLFPVPYVAKDGASDEDAAAAKAAATVKFAGQPVGMIVATSRREAEAATSRVRVECTLEKGVYCVEDAVAADKVDKSVLQCAKGDTGEVFKRDGLKVFEGSFTIGGQSHFTMEKHTTVACPDEQGRMILYASTQAPDIVRGFISAVIGYPPHKVEVNVKRLGGGFGSRFTKNLWVAAAAAVAANKLGCPVKMQNSIYTDMVMGGNCRHPFVLNYKAAVDPSTNRVKAFELEAFQDRGCATDFSPFVGNEIISHSESLYDFEAIKVDVHMFNSNTSSNTAVRAPGIAQAIIIGETMMDHMALALGLDAEEFRQSNFLPPDGATMGGLPVALTGYTMPRIWEELKVSSELAKRKAEIEKFNAASKWVKRGIAMTPSRYSLAPGINAGVVCLINVHGSDQPGPTVEVHHGGIEMGQGLNTKVQQFVALRLGVDLGAVHVHATSTAVIPNMSIIGGSIGSETTVAAAGKACDLLQARLQPVKELIMKERNEASEKDGKPPPAGEPDFAEICKKATGGLMEGLKVNLQVSANYTPKEGLAPGQEPWEFEKSPLPQGVYLAFGAGCSEVEVDVLTGDVRVLRSDLLYDCGHSLNPMIDIGQAEGAYVFGQGFYLNEEIYIAPDGECITKGTWEYKPTTVSNMPTDFRVTFLKDSPYPHGVMRSKAVGEPPLVLAYSMVAAVKQALAASRKERGLSPDVRIDIPASCTRVREAAAVTPQDLVASLE